MEQEKLKEIWTSLDNRMQQQEGLNTATIRQMLINKSDKALSRLINYTYFSTLACVAGIPLLVWVWTSSSAFAHQIIAPLVILFLIYGIITGLVQLRRLHKVNFSMPINQNLIIVHKLSLFNKYYVIASYIIGAILFMYVFITAIMSFNNVEPWRWGAFGAGLLIGAIGCVWEYKRMYRRNFESILKSLEELKEL